MSSRYGMRYSRYVGFAPDSGRYRFTRKTTSWSAISILPLDGLPLRDLHGRIVDPRRAVGPECEGVLEVVRVVAGRMVRAAVRPARLPAVQRAVSDRRGDVEHEVDLEEPRQFRVEHAVLVREADVGKSLPELRELAARVREARFVSEDPDVPLHPLLHLDADPREGLLPPFATQEAIEDPRLIAPKRFPGGRPARIRGFLLRVLRGGEATPFAENEALAQAVRSEAVCAVDRHAGRLPDRVEPRKGRLSFRVRRDAAHDVVLPRPDRDRLAERGEGPVLLREPAGHPQLLVDRPGAEMTQVEAEVLPVRPFECAPRLHLLDHRPGADVPRPEFHFPGEVPLHVSLPVLVDQVAALAARRFRDQDAGPREARRMELDILHVFQRHAGAIGEGHPVARLDEPVRRELVDAAAAAGREDRRLPRNRDESAAAEVEGDDALTRPAIDDEARDEVLVEAMDVLELHRGLEERVEDVEPDFVRGEARPLDGHPAKRALTDAAVIIAGPRASPVLELDDLPRTPRDEEFDRVLVGEEIGALDRVTRVQLDGIVISKDGRGAAFRGNRVAPHRVDLRDDRDGQVRVRLRRGDCRS